MKTRDDNSASADEFVAIYTRHERDLFRFIATLVPVRSDAEDVAQETAKVLWQKFSQYDPQRPFLPWACTFARYQVLTYLQRAKTHHKHFSPAVVEELADRRLSQDERLAAQKTALRACLQKLSDDERQLLAQRYRDPTSLAATIAQAGKTVNAIYKRLGRIRSKVADCVRITLAKEGWS